MCFVTRLLPSCTSIEDTDREISEAELVLVVKWMIEVGYLQSSDRSNLPRFRCLPTEVSVASAFLIGNSVRLWDIKRSS
jgi:hypothetical protein